MRELEREPLTTPLHLSDATIVVVGRGHVGRSLTSAAEAAELDLRLVSAAAAPAEAAGADVALLCVPDEAIPATAESLAAADPRPALLGHTSGATTLSALGGAGTAASFSVHPLQTFPDANTPVAGTPCAIAGTDPLALEFARGFAEALEMRPFEVSDEHRAAYHAAACISSNFLVALEEMATEAMAQAGVEDARELLAPLVLRTAANWAERGPEALTGPIARGDGATVERHREALAELAPELLAAYDALAERASAVAERRDGR